jgi:hypothetical protein
MSEPISRRDALKNLALMAGVLVASQAARHVQAADATPHVTPTDAMAVSLSYFEDSSKVDVKKFPTYAAGQRCGTCLQFKGQATDAFGRYSPAKWSAPTAGARFTSRRPD